MLTFRISGQGKKFFGDGMALWFMQQAYYVEGDFHGSVERFTGKKALELPIDAAAAAATTAAQQEGGEEEEKEEDEAQCEASSPRSSAAVVGHTPRWRFFVSTAARAPSVDVKSAYNLHTCD